jgi:hypothetical protein
LSTVDLSSARWRKSSRSGGGTNGSCVEVAFAAAQWRKSSRSGGGVNGDCVEVAFTAAQWRKSSRSNSGGNGSCVEVAFAGPATAIRDSKNPDGAALVLPAPHWVSFLTTLR